MENITTDQISLMMLIVTIVAIVSPIITSLINVYYTIKVQKTEVKNQIKITKYNNLNDLYSKYIESITNLISLSKQGHVSLDDEATYKRFYLQSLLVADEPSKILLKEIDNLIIIGGHGPAYHELPNLAELFSAQLNSIK